MKIIDKGPELLWTTYRSFDVSDIMIYRHDIQWRPTIQNGVIVQRICRTLKAKATVTFDNLPTDAAYWELWEVYQGHVYPFNLMRGGNPFVPGGKTSPGQIQFDPTGVAPYLKAKQGMSQPGAATQANHAAAVHDRFTEATKGLENREGKWKIYAEAYLLNAVQVNQQKAWLATFKVDYNKGAGNLPMRMDDGHKPLESPTVLRYEAGEFNFKKGSRTSRNRAFPAKSTIARYPCGEGGDVNTTGEGLNQHY